MAFSYERSSERAAVHPAREEGSRESKFHIFERVSQIPVYEVFYEIYSTNFLAGYL